MSPRLADRLRTFYCTCFQSLIASNVLSTSIMCLLERLTNCHPTTHIEYNSALCAVFLSSAG